MTFTHFLLPHPAPTAFLAPCKHLQHALPLTLLPHTCPICSTVCCTFCALYLLPCAACTSFSSSWRQTLTCLTFLQQYYPACHAATAFRCGTCATAARAITTPAPFRLARTYSLRHLPLTAAAAVPSTPSSIPCAETCMNTADDARGGHCRRQLTTRAASNS